MVKLLKQDDAKRLGLPGMSSLEPVSAEIGSRVSFRIATIAVATPDAAKRGPHVHRDFEECIYVMSGQGTMHSESGEHSVQPGDTLLVPAGEKHMTINTGAEPLVLLCFFPVGDVSAGTTEFPSF